MYALRIIWKRTRTRQNGDIIRGKERGGRCAHEGVAVGVRARAAKESASLLQFPRRGLVRLNQLINVRVRVQIVRHARTHSVCNDQSCMVSNVGLIVHARRRGLARLNQLAPFPIPAPQAVVGFGRDKWACTPAQIKTMHDCDSPTYSRDMCAQFEIAGLQKPSIQGDGRV